MHLYIAFLILFFTPKNLCNLQVLYGNVYCFGSLSPSHSGQLPVYPHQSSIPKNRNPDLPFRTFRTFRQTKTTISVLLQHH